MNPVIIFQKLKSTVDGIGASTGKQTEEAFNDNFDLVKKWLDTIIQILSLQVSSEQMKQIKVDTSVSPSVIYYSLDDVSVTNPTWVKLLTFSFSDLAGSPYDNIALKTILDSKAPQGDLDNLTLQVTACINDITNIQTTHAKDVADLKAKDTALDTEIANLKTKDNELSGKIDANKNDITNIKATLQDAVMTTHGDSLWLKYDPTKSELKMSTDKGTTWGVLGTLALRWDQLSGKPEDSADLIALIASKITAALVGYVPTPTFTQHIKDYDNPHKVTAAQVGLGNVLQLISDLQGAAIDLVTANQTSYLKHLTDIPNKSYLLSSHFSRAKLIIEDDGYFEYKKTIGSSETYTGPDGTQITVSKWEGGWSSPYYKINYNTDDQTKIDIYWNQTLYDWVQAGGVLD